MTLLSILLVFKVAISVLLLIIPFLFSPASKLDELTKMKSQSAKFYRLYAVATFALVIAYSGGIYQISRGVFPLEIILMGIASNIGAPLVLLGIKPISKANKISAAIFGSIGLGLIAALLLPEMAMRMLF